MASTGLGKLLTAPGARDALGLAFDWAIAAKVQAAGVPIFVAGGLTPTSVTLAVEQVCNAALQYGVIVALDLAVPVRYDGVTVVVVVVGVTVWSGCQFRRRDRWHQGHDQDCCLRASCQVPYILARELEIQAMQCSFTEHARSIDARGH